MTPLTRIAVWQSSSSSMPNMHLAQPASTTWSVRVMDGVLAVAGIPWS